MRFLNRGSLSNRQFEDEGPISNVANLFDVSVVFIVALFFALFLAYSTLDLFNPDSELVISKKGINGEIQIIRKKGTEIKIERVTESTDEGKGIKLGTAYELENGKIIYIPED